MAFTFNNFKEEVMEGLFDLLSLTIHCALVKSGSDPVFNADDVFVSDFFGRAENIELTDASYGRVALGSKTVVQDDTADRGEFASAKAVFASLAGGELVEASSLFDNAGGADSARKLICYSDLADTTTNGNNFDVLPDGTDPGDWLRLT